MNVPGSKLRNDRKVGATSIMRIVIFSGLVSSLVFVTAAILQWAIYDDWLHHTGPVRLVGTSIAAVLTFVFISKWLLAERAREAEMLRRFEVIAEMNDRIRNAVQAIACTDYAYHPESAENVHQAVTVIDDALRGMVATVNTVSRVQPQAVETPKATAHRRKA